MSQLKIAVIGGGGISAVHLPHLQSRDDVELVGLADLNPATRQTAQTFGIARFTGDFRELLPLCDAVLICVPTHLHSAIAVEALNVGKAVFCEKPLARTLEQADSMAAAAQKSGAVLQVGFVRRFDDEWLAWRDAIQGNRIGRPVVWNDVSSISGPPAPWFYRDEQGGGPFLDGCIHNYDFALHTFGPAQWAFCHARTLREGATAIDTGTATVHFQSGDELMLAWSWGLPQGCSGARVFEILGPRGLLRWPQSGSEANTGDVQPHFLVDRGESCDPVPFSAKALPDAFARQMDEFVAVAKGEKAPRAGWREGRAALQLALAVLESGRSGQVVNLKGETR